MSAEEGFRGIMSRRKGIFSSWKPHTYVIKGNFLLEYKVGSNTRTAEPLAIFDITSCICEDASLITGRRESFLFHCQNGKSFFFLAPTIKDKEMWISMLRETADDIKHGHERAPSYREEPVSDSSSDRRSQVSNDAVEIESQLQILKYLESFTDAVVVSNSNAIIIAVNSAAEKLFGRPKSEMQGENLGILMPEPYKSQHDGYMFRHEKFGSEKLIGKTRNLKGERKSGEVFPLQISLGKLPVPGYYIATMREIMPSVTVEVPKAKMAAVHLEKSAEAVATV